MLFSLSCSSARDFKLPISCGSAVMEFPPSCRSVSSVRFPIVDGSEVI